MKKSALIAVMTVCVLVFAGSAMAQNLVSNGGFEAGNFTSWTQVGNTDFTGVGTGYDAHSGTYGAYFGAVGSPGGIQQILTTTAGSSYTVDFWLQNDGGTPNSFSVSFDGITLTSFGTPADGNDPGFTWKEFTFDAVATSSSTVLRFNIQQDPNYYELDDISVIADTPEPAPLALLGSGLLGLGGALRRKLLAR